MEGVRGFPDDVTASRFHHSVMAGLFSFLARRRWAGVGLAVMVEAAILLPMGLADPSAVVGLPAVIAATVAGTVAVVYGPLDGALVAFVGAVLFGAAGGWSAGEVAALAVWPGVVAAAGLFARQVGRQRTALTQLVATQEEERQRLALELHDEIVQTLTGALLALTQLEAAAADAGDSAGRARALIQETIRSLRDLAVELRPKALDDFGLAPAVERLAADVTRRTGTEVDVDVDLGASGDRLPRETELTVFRAVQEVLGRLAGAGGEPGPIRVAIQRLPGATRVLIEGGASGSAAAGVELDGLRERVRLAGGRLTASTGSGGTTVNLLIPMVREG